MTRFFKFPFFICVLIFILTLFSPSIYAIAPSLHISVLFPYSATNYYWSTIIKRINETAKANNAQIKVYGLYEFGTNLMIPYFPEILRTKPDGLIVTVTKINTLQKYLQDVIDSNIKLVIIDSGIESLDKLSDAFFVGNDPEQTVKLIGQRMLDLGSHNLLCINNDPTNFKRKSICQNMQLFLGKNGKVITINVNKYSHNTKKINIESVLIKNPDIDGIINLDSFDVPAIINALSDIKEILNNKIIFSTIGVTPIVMQYILNGSISFAIYEQEQLQGYIAVQYLTLPKKMSVKEYYDSYKNSFVDKPFAFASPNIYNTGYLNRAILIEPKIIDKSNALAFDRQFFGGHL